MSLAAMKADATREFLRMKRCCFGITSIPQDKAPVGLFIYGEMQ